jgi:hypothetical protein
MILWASLLVAFAGANQLPGIEGLVRDSSGALQGARVVATPVSGGSPAVAVVTRKDGTFSIPNLPLGSYRVTVELPGYLTQSQEPITVWPLLPSHVVFELTFLPPQPVVVGGDPLPDPTFVFRDLFPLPRGRSLTDVVRSLRSL